MATDKKLLELKNKFERNVNLFKTLKLKEVSHEIKETEMKTLKELEVELDSVMQEPKTLSALPVSTNLAIGKMIDISNSLTTIFTYTPVTTAPKSFINSKWSDVKTDDLTLLPKYEKVSNGMVIGNTKQTFGVVDDLYNYNGQPTLKLERLRTSTNNETSITRSKIGNQYSISFIFRLNRFPSKAYMPGSFVERVTTRRTDLLAFEYFNNCKIEFGAMAPYGRYVKNQQRVDENGAKENICLEYKGKYSPFSIAANLTCNGFSRSTSIYTDYKFELGKDYHVTLLITKTNDMSGNPFGTPDAYAISLSVDNVLENTGVVDGKVWGKNFNGVKATKPNFLLPDSSDYLIKNNLGKKYNVDNQSENVVVLGEMSIEALRTITSSPNVINRSDNRKPVMLIPNTLYFNKSMVSKYLYKINNGVDIGSIYIATGGVGKKSGGKTPGKVINTDVAADPEVTPDTKGV